MSDIFYTLYSSTTLKPETVLMTKHFRLLPVAMLCLLVTVHLQAQVNITSTATPYTQNFNTLVTSGSSSTLPTGWVLLETGTAANTTLTADAGSTATGNTYSYGTGTATERAFGALRSGSLVPTYGVQIRNSTGATITSINISYTGEQWRCGATGRTDQIDFQYSLSATSLSTGTWTDVNALDFASPSTTSTGAKDGNAAANRSAKSTVITGLNIANNAIIWLRWNDLDASGADDGLSIDDFSIQLNGADVTAPTTSTVTPSNGSTGIALSGNLVITFSENIQKGTTGNITVKRTSDNVTVQTTAVTAASVTVSSNSATIPYSGLANSVAYYVNIDAGSFSDLAGNNHAGIAGSATWGFTTLAGGGGGALNYYFGNLHAHSSYSDGNADNTTKIPSDDYTYAKTALCMDFLGISEHNHATAGMSIANWQPGRTQAAAATTSTFVGLYGMEWGVISGGGHVIVYGMDSLIGWEAGNYDIFVAKSVYTGTGGLFDILNRHGGNALAYLAHPNNTDFNNVLGNAFDVNADNAIVGSTVETGPAFSTNTTYTNPGTSMAHLSYYRNMLAKGYHLGPTIDHDNHNMTFGHTAKTRLVIRASTLTENNLLDGMKKMRFYASQDCSAKIDFTVNTTDVIGSIVTRAGAPVIGVTSTGTTSTISSVKIMYGVPGSGTAATQLTSNASGTFTYTDNGLANGSQRYYYLDITETDGSRIITAPIWYTRNDAAKGTAPASITSFFTVNEKDRVILKWTTENEEPEQWFDVQRSIDGGISYTSLGMVNGKGMSADMQTYALSDMQPFAGVAYYRLVQRNKQGDVRFTDVKVISRQADLVTYYTIYPNPVQGMLNIRLSAASNEQALTEVFDLNGRRMLSRHFNVLAGEQTLGMDMSRLGNGTYIFKLTIGGKTSSQLVNKF